MWWKQRTDPSTHSLNFMTALMLPPAPVFFLLLQPRHRKQDRAEITNNNSITKTIFISCATSFHNFFFQADLLWLQPLVWLCQGPQSKSRGSCRSSSDITKSARPLLLVGTSHQNMLQENLGRMYYLTLFLPFTNTKKNPAGLPCHLENILGNA